MRKLPILFLLLLLFSFRKKNGIGIREVNLYGVRLNIPAGWQMTSLPKGKMFVRGVDTLFFLPKDPYTFLMAIKQRMADCMDPDDTACLSENRRLQHFNDSLVQANPKMLLYDYTTIYSDNGKWGCSGWLPSGNTRVSISISFFGLHKFKTVLYLSSSPMNIGEAASLRSIFETAH